MVPSVEYVHVLVWCQWESGVLAVWTISVCWSRSAYNFHSGAFFQVRFFVERRY